MPDALLIEPYADPSGTSATPRHGGLRHRLGQHLRLKLGLTGALTLLFCIPYFLIGYLPLHPPATLPLTALDRIIPFDPRWTLVYQSLYVFIPIAPFLARRRAELRRYATSFTLLTLAGMLIFLFYPTLCPRPSPPQTSGVYNLLVNYDPATNAFPSMHVALATLSLLTGMRMLAEERTRWRRPLEIIGISWLLAIAYATLATKQHYAVDLPAGAGLAALAFMVVPGHATGAEQ